MKKNGQGCIFLPSDKNIQEAVAALENDVKVAASTSSPVKKILPKLKVCNLTNYCAEDKSELRTAILEKNVEVKECIENNENVVFEVLFITSADNNRSCFAVIKVSPCLRDIIVKIHWLFIDMESHYVTDYHQIVQCYKCQGVGHKSDSKICPMCNTNCSVCLYCLGDHKSGQSTFKTSTDKRECTNCKNGKTL